MTAAIEDYSKAIYSLEQRSEEPVTTNELAARLKVSPASASAMARRLDELELGSYSPYRGITLTERGRRLALEVLRHHRLLELYLVEALDVPWDRVHDEAEVLEHAISEELEELIAAKLGDPSHDPHGDPIPTKEGGVEEGATDPLDSLAPGQRGTFTRVSDSQPEMLRHLAELGIGPGDSFEVIERQPFGGPIVARFGEQVHSLGSELAAAMRVEVEP